MQIFLEELIVGLFELLTLPIDAHARKSLGCFIAAFVGFVIALIGMIVLAYFLVRITQV